MKIAITGAGGLVGGHLARRLAAEHEVWALKHGDLDITDREAVRRWCLGERPELIINCAVLNVDECERDPGLAQAINVTGPQALAEAAAEVEAECLHFSTNYVFDGKRPNQQPYTIKDEPRPINIYGHTKFAGERAVRETARRSFILRTSWVFGSGKENFLSTAHRHLLLGERLRAIADVWASATYVADLVTRTVEILKRHHYATYHVVNDGVCSYLEFALEAARLVGTSEAQIEQLIEVVNETEMRRLALRPRYTPMHCLASEELGLAPLRDWRAALADYIQADRRAGHNG